MVTPISAAPLLACYNTKSVYRFRVFISPGLYIHLRASVTKQYSLVPVPAKGVISLVGKVTVNLVESNGSLPPGL